tara:strand:+ start:552 stop:731 length:180 start_codon:yes stop_codon:yes gene_type:complete
MKGVLQIVGVFFAGALVGFMLLGFGLSVNISMMTGTVIILLLAYFVTKQNNKQSAKKKK